MTPLSVCIFAHNEQRLLPRTIGALEAAAGKRPFSAHILVNGSTDETVHIARLLAKADLRLTVHELPVADKANAWNRYVHDIAPNQADIHTHIFLDGDITPSAGSFAALADELAIAPRAYGAGALPITGRSRRSWSRRLLEKNYLSGNLYALTQTALDALLHADIKMPYGAKGEDGILTYLLLTDLQAGRDDTHTYRIINPPEATFQFDSLDLRSNDFQIMHRRMKRYAERHFQKQILYALLKKHGLSALPEDIYDIYTNERLAEVKPRHDPLNYIYDIAIRRTLLRHACQKDETPNLSFQPANTQAQPASRGQR